MKSTVFIQLPKAGLGNMMLVWARGATFAKLNQLHYATSYWQGIRLGTIIRGEKKKRIYRNNFKETPFFEILKNKFSLKKIVYDPPIEVLPTPHSHHKYLITKMSSDDDLFGDVREHRDFILNELSRKIHPRIYRILEASENPVISVHIRRGDFKIANYITSLSFFKDAVTNIRSVFGANLPVTVFSDADTEELKEILEMPFVERAKNNPDIADILLMSKSKFLVLSRSSSFSYWAAFLSAAFVILHKDDWQKTIGTDINNPTYREVRWENGDDEYTNNLLQELNAWKIK